MNAIPFHLNSFFTVKGSHRNGDLLTCENNRLFSRVKISCFCAKSQPCIFIGVYAIKGIITPDHTSLG